VKTAFSESLFFDVFESPIAILYLVFSGRYLTGISFNKKPQIRKGAITASFRKELNEYFTGKTKGFIQGAMFLEGTDFERSVWNALREVPYGETRTYKWLAEEIGNPKANRAVGRALSRNPIPIVFPCHRIVESSGSLGGYSAGINIKRRLLGLEYYNMISAK
jgi:methylated-DNA-[protein]-cysteine S-methyltransferase